MSGAEATLAVDAPGSQGDGTSSLVRRSLGSTTAPLLGVLLVMCVVFTAIDPTAFLSTLNIRNLLINASVLMVISVGTTFVIVSRNIDIAIGSVLVFAGVIAARVMSSWDQPQGVVFIGGLLAALAAGAVWGLLHGLVVSKTGIPSLIVTLGTLGIALGAALLLAGPQGTDITDIPTGIVSNVGNGLLLGQMPVLVLVAAAVALLGALVLSRTRFGLQVRAVGSNAEAARRVGVPVDRHLISVFVIGGVTAGLGGFLALIQFSTTAVTGHSQDSLNAITAVILGGTSLFGGRGTVLGTVIGVMIPAVLINGLVIAGLQPFWQQIAVGVVLIVAVFFDAKRRGVSL